MDILNKAIIYATNAHKGQLRKAKDKPYILHPMEAAVIAGYITSDKEVIAAAVLHDVVEDTSATLEDIRREFGEKVAALVGSDSEDKMDALPATLTWELRKKATLDALDKATPDEQIICLADKLANIREMRRDHEILGDKLWERFNQKDKAKHAWYYRGIADRLTALSSTLPYAEYCSILDELFD